MLADPATAATGPLASPPERSASRYPASRNGSPAPQVRRSGGLHREGDARKQEARQPGLAHRVAGIVLRLGAMLGQGLSLIATGGYDPIWRAGAALLAAAAAQERQVAARRTLEIPARHAACRSR